MGVLAKGRRVALVAFLGVALLTGATARGGEAVVLGAASAANLKGLFTKLGTLAEKFVPGAGEQVKGASAMLTQAPEWAGVDWGKPATIVLFGGKAFGKDEPVAVGFVTVADADLFRKARPEGGPMAFDVRGNIAIFSEEKAALAAVTPERLALYGAYPKVAAGTDVYLTAYIGVAMAEYQGEIEEGLKELEQGVANMPGGGPMATIAKAAKCVGPLVRLAGKQVRRVTLTATFNDDSVDIWGRLYAAEDTALGTFLSSQPAETTDLVKYLPADAVLGMACKLDMEKGKPLADAIIQAIAGPLEITAADQQKMRDLMFASTQTGEFAAAVASGAKHPGLQSIQVNRIGDAAKYRETAKSGIDWLMKGGLGAFMEAAGMKMTVEHKPNAREYQGVTIDRLTVTTTLAPGAEPNPLMGQQPPQVTEYAAVGTVAAAASNNPDGDLLNGALDRIKGGGTPGMDTAAAWKSACAAAPKGANVVAYLCFNSFLAKAVEELAKQQPAIAMMAGAVIKADPTEEPIVSYASFGKDMVELRTRVPHQPILTLVTRVRAMVEQQAKPGLKGGPKPKDQDDF